MNAAAPATASALSPPELRRRRANVARRLLAGAPAVADTLEWADLDAAPAWLTLSDPDLARFARRVGALVGAPTMRLWIDKPRMAAAREAVGATFLQRLLSSHEAQASMPGGMLGGPVMSSAEQVAPALRASGFGVLLSTLEPGPLRDAMIALWAPVPPSEMAGVFAQMLVDRATSLAQEPTT